MQDVTEVEVPASASEEVLTPPNDIVLESVAQGTPEAQADVVQDADPAAAYETFLGMDTTAWLFVAFVLFIGILIYFKIPSMIANALDGRGERIRTELDEAKALRAEAEALLDEQKKKAAESARDAETIIANARAEAETIVADAEVTATAMVARRKEAAENKIAAAERAAERDLRSRVAELATAASERVIADEIDAKARAAMTDDAIAKLGARLN
ncbi:MAG: F0F1 ATP synthase subunit B [Pacificimonas sp.]|jgi:F-type H+-transporting ATPase subunit b|nr:F0F1 ATP synthase subunit B [Pacificimonas sp.]